MVFSSSAPRNALPSGSTPEGSIGNFPSKVRHAPTASKFSKPKPRESIRAWHEAHTRFFRCCSNCWRSDADEPTASSSRLGTLAGGGGGGEFNILSRIHFPRSTGEVRFPYEETSS